MVIQRWQTVLLAMAAILMGVFSFQEIAQIQTADFTYSMTTLSLSSEGIPTDGSSTEVYSTWYFFALSILSVIISIIDIFLFKNLGLQRKLCWVNILFMIACCAVAVTIAYCTFEKASVQWNYSFLCAPIVAIFATIMAARRISSDENKLKSIDRIR